MIYKNYKFNLKFFKHPMEKFMIISWNVWNQRNQILLKKIQHNPFLIIEKATLVFQNLYIVIGDPYMRNERQKVLRMVEKWIHWIPPIIGRFKLNFDGLGIQNRSTSG